MSNEIALFGNMPLPAHLQETTGLNDYWDDVGGTSLARIRMEGNVLEVVRGSEVLARSEPLQPLRMVILRPSKVGRVCYINNYTPGSKDSPDCYSNDNIRPAADAKSPQCTRCDLCPWNVKGTGGNGESKKCRYRQTLAVWMPGENDSTWDTVFQLALSSTAIFNDEVTPAGYMALNKLMSVFRAARMDPTKAWVDVAVDAYAAHKRIVMKPAAPIMDPQEYAQVQVMLESPETERIVSAGVLDMDSPEVEAAAHHPAAAAHAPVQNSPVSNDSTTINPFTGEVLYEDSPVVDNVPTYWQELSSGTIVCLQPGTNLPVETPDINEVTAADFEAYESALVAQRIARERAAEEERMRAQQAAAAAAAAAVAATTRQRGVPPAAAAAPAPTRQRGVAAAPAAEPAPTRQRGAAAAPAAEPAPTRQRGAAATPTPAPAAEASAGRRRNAAPTATATPSADATAGTRQRGAPAAADVVPAGRTSRRASVNAAQNTHADASPAVRQAQEQAAAAPEDEQPRVVKGGDADLDPAVAAALEAALLQNNE